MRWELALGVLATASGCGRVAFEPLGAGDPDAGSIALVDYRTAVLESRPIAYYRLSDLEGLAPTVARDEAGAYPGVYGGACDKAPGLLVGDTDGAVVFDGTTCAIDLGDTFAFLGTAPWTIEAWFRRDGDNLAGDYQHVFTRQARFGGPNAGYGLVVAEDSASPSSGVFVERKAFMMTTGEAGRRPLALGELVHAVAIFDGSQLRLVVDGEQFSSSHADPMASYTAHAWIGWADEVMMFDNTNFFTGVIDEVAVYDRVLPDQDIQRHAAIGRLGPQPR